MYQNLYSVEKIKYNERKCYVCCVLKVCNILLGHQDRYTKFLCFCVNGTRAIERHWEVNRLTEKKTLSTGDKKILRMTHLLTHKKLCYPLYV